MGLTLMLLSAAEIHKEFLKIIFFVLGILHKQWLKVIPTEKCTNKFEKTELFCKIKFKIITHTVNNFYYK